MFVKIYGHGGQGVDTARKILGKAALLSGFYVQDLIVTGLERRPTFVYGFVKFDKKPIISKELEEPDAVLILSKELLNEAKSIKDSGFVITNSAEKVSIPVKDKKVKMFYIDANGIVVGLSKKSIPNVAMLGAFTKVFDNVTMKSMKTALQEVLGDAKENFTIFDEGYKNVKRC
jgi:2-oxoacid:acceptor oxidoreductase gamma subunit (pyruvate/2-ketoisovalerate family)